MSEEYAFLYSVGQFIRSYLMEHGEAYVGELYREFSKGRKKHKDTYQSFRNYIYWFKKLGLIEFVRQEPSKNPNLKPRRFYRLTKKGRELSPYSPEWSNPRRALYPGSWRKYH